MKKTNPVVNYQILENNGEYILDFLITENSKDSKEILIAERNIYRYKSISKDKNKGVLLFAVSERGYSKNMETFFNNLKTNSSQLIEIVGNYKLPNIEIK